MAIDIIYNIEEYEGKYDELIEKSVTACLKEENVSDDIEVSITITDNEEIKEINNEHRNIDKATDVLSFPQYEDMDELESDVFKHIGDIIISVDKVKEQAIEYNHSEYREMSYMVVHGMLHLLFYDHIDDDEKVIMRAKEKKILGNLGATRDA